MSADCALVAIRCWRTLECMKEAPMSEALNTPNEAVGVAESSTDTGLRRNAIGLSEVLFQSITAMAPAAAVATALTPAIPFAGASLPLAVLMATIACAFIAANIGQ